MTHDTVVRNSAAVSNVVYVESGDRISAAMPFFWVGGLVATMFPAFHRGGNPGLSGIAVSRRTHISHPGRKDYPPQRLGQCPGSGCRPLSQQRIHGSKFAPDDRCTAAVLQPDTQRTDSQSTRHDGIVRPPQPRARQHDIGRRSCRMIGSRNARRRARGYRSRGRGDAARQRNRRDIQFSNRQYSGARGS